MESDKTLKELHREQLEIYPILSQEEIVSLYESEEIDGKTIDATYKSYNLEIKLKKGELDLLLEKHSEKRVFFGMEEPETEETSLLEYHINELERKVKELDEINQSMLRFLPSSEQNDNTIENTIQQLKREIAVKKKQIDEQQTKKKEEKERELERIDELQKEIIELEENVKKLSRSYKTFANKFSISTRGRTPKDRKFPSIELRNKSVLGTLGFAKYWAGVYYRRSGNTVPFDDLHQAAREALMSAANYYVPNDEAKFITYARRCIENKLKKEVYNKKKMKKRPYKPEHFFEKEQDKIKYIQMFLGSVKTKSNSGKTRYYSDIYVESISVILFRLKESVRRHNWQMRVTEQTDRLLPSYSGRGDQAKLDVIVKRIVKMINESKIEAIITDDDRQLASMLVNYQGIGSNKQEIYQLIHYLELYLYKLDLIEKCFKATRKLTIENNNITPTDEEILDELNSIIKAENKERAKLRKGKVFDPAWRYLVGKEKLYKEHLEKMIIDIETSDSKEIILDDNERLFIIDYGKLSFLSWKDAAETIKEKKEYIKTLDRIIEEITNTADENKEIALVPCSDSLTKIARWEANCNFPRFDFILFEKKQEALQHLIDHKSGTFLYLREKVMSKEKTLKTLKKWLKEVPDEVVRLDTDYMYLHDYYGEYLHQYGVDPFITPDEYKRGDYISKQKEKDDIAAQFGYKDDNLGKIDWMIESIEESEEEQIGLYFEENGNLYCGEWTADYENDVEDGSIFFTKEEALTKLKTIKEEHTVEVETEEEYVKRILQERKDRVNSILIEKNAPIIEKNKEIKKLRDLCSLGIKNQRQLKIGQLTDIKKDIEILFGDDPELLLLMTSGKSTGKWYSPNTPIDDEVFSNLFLDDYYKALEDLPELERQVLLMWFDENGTHTMKAKEIGSELGITENRVCKVKSLALKRLRENETIKAYNET